MAGKFVIHVLSDIHYAGPAEKARGRTELSIIKNPVLRRAVAVYRHFIWRRDPFAHNHRLDDFLRLEITPDLVVANGDYSCDTAFIGVSDLAAMESAQLCLGQLRARFEPKLQLVLGDHELGKMSLFGGRGGMRLASWSQAQTVLGIEPFWTRTVGQYLLLGVASSLVALPVFEPDTLPSERDQWRDLRQEHLERIRTTFAHLQPQQRVILFCHDPTALPCLWREKSVQSKSGQIEATIIGHLHSRLFLWKSRLLRGMPVIRRCGNSIQRMSTALNESRLWRHFQVKLCPALAGIELLNDGGYCRLVLCPEAAEPLQFEVRPLPVA